MTDVDKKSPLGIRWSAIALLLGIFAAGAASGAGVYHWAARDCGPMGHPPHGGPLHRDLGLSEAQAKQVDAIMVKYHPELDAVIRETFPRVKAVHEKIDREIRPLLNDEQRRRFDQIKSQPPGPGMRPPPFGPDRHPPGPPGDMPPPGPPGVAPPGMAMPPGVALPGMASGTEPQPPAPSPF